jgi:parallel beta helix pectate lyase-like protein
MKRMTRCFTILLLSLLTGGVAQAQATRTWVSGVGDDANPCSRTAPCKTFAGSISKTAVGGEIDALDPGGFGAVTITKSITIDGGGGQVASVLVNGTNGIVVAAPSTDLVTLRNLRINGIGGGLSGIRFISGRGLHIEHCSIFGFTNHGIDIAPSAGAKVSVIDTFATNNTQNGINVLGAVRVFVTIDRSRFEHNGNYGVFVGDFTRATVRDSDASENGVGFIAQANAGDVVMNIANSTAGNNTTTGIQAGGGTNASVVRLAGVSIFSNAVNGLVVGTNGSIISFGNNYNSGNGAPTSTIAPQ